MYLIIIRRSFCMKPLYVTKLIFALCILPARRYYYDYLFVHSLVYFCFVASFFLFQVFQCYSPLFDLILNCILNIYSSLYYIHPFTHLSVPSQSTVSTPYYLQYSPTCLPTCMQWFIYLLSIIPIILTRIFPLRPTGGHGVPVLHGHRRESMPGCRGLRQPDLLPWKHCR